MDDSFLSNLAIVISVVVGMIILFHIAYYIRIMLKIGPSATNLPQIATSAIVTSVMTAGYAGLITYAFLGGGVQ